MITNKIFSIEKIYFDYSSTKTFWGRGDKKAYNSKTSHLAGLKNVRSMVE